MPPWTIFSSSQGKICDKNHPLFCHSKRASICRLETVKGGKIERPWTYIEKKYNYIFEKKCTVDNWIDTSVPFLEVDLKYHLKDNRSIDKDYTLPDVGF